MTSALAARKAKPRGQSKPDDNREDGKHLEQTMSNGERTQSLTLLTQKPRQQNNNYTEDKPGWAGVAEMEGGGAKVNKRPDFAAGNQSAEDYYLQARRYRSAQCDRARENDRRNGHDRLRNGDRSKSVLESLTASRDILLGLR